MRDSSSVIKYCYTSLNGTLLLCFKLLTPRVLKPLNCIIKAHLPSMASLFRSSSSTATSSCSSLVLTTDLRYDDW